jgi:hypothetical protein
VVVWLLVGEGVVVVVVWVLLLRLLVVVLLLPLLLRPHTCDCPSSDLHGAEQEAPVYRVIRLGEVK